MMHAPYYCSKCWRRPCECAGSRLLLQPLPTVERKVGRVTVFAPDYRVSGVAERVEADMRRHEAAQLNGTLAELIAFNLRWPR